MDAQDLERQWKALIDDEEALAEEERRLAEEEQALARTEREAADAIARLRDRHAEVAASLDRLAEAGLDEACTLRRSLPSLVPPPGIGERLSALATRREALEARRRRLERRAAAVETIQTGLATLEAALTGAEGRAQALERERARREAEAQRQREATQAAGPEPPSLETAAAPADDAGAPRLAGAPSTESGERPPEARAVPMPARGDARKAPRQRLEASVTFESQTNFFTGFAQNISEGGLFVATFDTLPVGTVTDLELTLPGGVRIRAAAEVRWVREFKEDAPEVWPGMGLMFTDLPAEAREAIEAFMARREPLFYAA